MDADDSQAEASPLIEADLGENGGRVAFDSITDAQRWIDGEIRAWQNFRSQLGSANAFRPIMERQLQLPTKIDDLLQQASQADEEERHKILKDIGRLLNQYVDYRSVCSNSEIGAALLKLPPGHRGLIAIGALAGLLGVPTQGLLESGELNERGLAAVFAGYAAVSTRTAVKRSDFGRHQTRLDAEFDRLTGIVGRAEAERTRISDEGNRVNVNLSELLESQRSTWDKFFRSANQEWEGLRNAFEEQLHLEAPATYWHKQADSTKWVAIWALIGFIAIAGSVIGVIVHYGPSFLERLAAIEGDRHFTTLALVSIPALISLWMLRHFARLFVTNLDRSADAKWRATMAMTFLALAKEGQHSIGPEERLMVLEALFRAPAPEKPDDGHFGGAL